jgi:hypothetical protein
MKVDLEKLFEGTSYQNFEAGDQGGKDDGLAHWWNAIVRIKFWDPVTKVYVWEHATVSLGAWTQAEILADIDGFFNLLEERVMKMIEEDSPRLKHGGKKYAGVWEILAVMRTIRPAPRARDILGPLK